VEFLKVLNPLYLLRRFWDSMYSTGNGGESPNAMRVERDYFVVFYLLLVAITAGLVILTLPYWSIGEWNKVATPFLGALACLASGWIAGFLFGIPKTNDPKMNAPPGAVMPSSPTPTAPTTPGGSTADENKPAGRPAPASDTPRNNNNHQRPRVNDNLEQISDWLTKIVVGLGLVELRNIPDYLDKMAVAFVDDLGWPCNRSYAVAFIVYFAIVGFIHGVLTTRLFLSLAIARADWEVNEKMYEPPYQAIFGALAQQTAQLEAQRSEMTSENLELKNELKFANFDLAVSDALAVLGMPRPDSDILNDAIKRLSNARLDYRDDRRAAYVLSELYVRKLKNYDEAIRISNDTLAAMKERNNENNYDLVILHYNLACYHSLRSAVPGTAPDQIAADHAKASEHLAFAVKLDAKVAQDAVNDKDLTAVKEETWFKQLTGAAAAPATSPPAAT